jgi:hypothetical protein
MAASERVQQILREVRGLDDDERAELETELLVQDATEGQAWGAEIDARAQRVLAGEAAGLGRDEVRALFQMSSAEARARLAELLDTRR